MVVDSAAAEVFRLYSSISAGVSSIYIPRAFKLAVKCLTASPLTILFYTDCIAPDVSFFKVRSSSPVFPNDLLRLRTLVIGLEKLRAIEPRLI